MTAPAGAGSRRTQAERSRATRERLVEATIEAIAEVGYHRASLGEICTRAEVSRGGLFRHYDSRIDLVVAAAEEVGRRHLAGFEAQRGPHVTIEDELRFARGRVRDATNAVWLELLVAARTDSDLRERLEPAVRTFYAGIRASAWTDHGPSAGPEVDVDAVELAVTSVLHLLDGETLLHHTYPRPELEERRLRGVAHLYAALISGREPERRSPG